MAALDSWIRLVENLYMVERCVNALEKEPRYYSNDCLLYSNEVHTLKVIALNEGITHKELTEMMLRTKGATSVMINKLVKKELVFRKVDAEDARIIRLYLTDQGKKVHDAHINYDKEAVGRWMKELHISESEIETTNHVIESIANYIVKSNL